MGEINDDVNDNCYPLRSVSQSSTSLVPLKEGQCFLDSSIAEVANQKELSFIVPSFRGTRPKAGWGSKKGDERRNEETERRGDDIAEPKLTSASSLTLALRKLMECKAPDGRYLVRYKYQWWAIYHVLVRCHRWPVGYHEFTERIAQLFPEGLRVPCTESTLKQLSQTRYMDALDAWRYDALYHGSPARFRLMRETVRVLEKIVNGIVRNGYPIEPI